MDLRCLTFSLSTLYFNFSDPCVSLLKHTHTHTHTHTQTHTHKHTRGPRWPCIAYLITRQVLSHLAFGFNRRISSRSWRPSWISNQNDFSHICSISRLDTYNKVSSKLAFWFRIKKFKIDFNMAARATIFDLQSEWF